MTVSEQSQTEELHIQPESEPRLPLLPLKNVVILPKSIIPIIVGRPLSIKAVEYALKHDRTLFITSQKSQNIENPTEKDLFAYGTRSTILQVMRMPNGALKVLAEGICRSKIDKFSHHDGFIQVDCTDLPTTSLDKEIELVTVSEQSQTEEWWIVFRMRKDPSR